LRKFTIKIVINRQLYLKNLNEILLLLYVKEALCETAKTTIIIDDIKQLATFPHKGIILKITEFCRVFMKKTFEVSGKEVNRGV